MDIRYALNIIEEISRSSASPAMSGNAMAAPKIRDLIEASQISPYYHASESELPIGTVLEPRNKNMVDGDIEDILEANRPKRRRPRSECVFMVEDLRLLPHLAIKGDFVYRVKPSRPVVRLDHTWVNQIWRLLAEYENDQPKWVKDDIARFAKGYWSGLNCRGLRPIFECLAPSATIIEQLK